MLFPEVDHSLRSISLRIADQVQSYFVPAFYRFSSRRSNFHSKAGRTHKIPGRADENTFATNDSVGEDGNISI